MRYPLNQEVPYERQNLSMGWKISLNQMIFGFFRVVCTYSVGTEFCRHDSTVARNLKTKEVMEPNHAKTDES